MALAGPGANFTLLLLAGAAIRLGMAIGIFQNPINVNFTRITEAVNPGGASFAATFLSILFVLNLVLGIFNLLPVPPLDGRTVITLLMSEKMGLKYLGWTSQPGFGMLGLLISWVLFGKVFGIIFTLALNLLYPGAHYG
jgi:Zn-dependent protease